MSERKKKGFNYVDIVTSGCKGWINLFFGEHVIALIDNVFLAEKIKAAIDANSIELPIPPDPQDESVVEIDENGNCSSPIDIKRDPVGR